MAVQSARFDTAGVSGNGPSSDGTFTPQNTDTDPSGPNFFIENNDPNATSFNVGDQVFFNESSDGFGDSATYEGYYDDGSTKHPFILSGGNYYLLGGPAGQSYPIAQADYTPCFCSGTHLLTARGEVAVEDLRAGDLAVTASGARRPVRWIGRGTVHPRRHPRPGEVMPVRIRAGALGEGRPARDLCVSPGHGIALDLIGEVIVTAGCLVNGSTIVQEDAERVTYWHVELDAHDLLIAEGQAAESYLDMGNRAFLDRARGGSAVVALAGAPDPAARSHADFCRPFHGDGPVLAFVRERLAARAAALGWHLSGEAPWAGVHLLADGVRVEPEVRGLAARFRAPAGAEALWLVSPTASPAELGVNPDPRLLGLLLAELRAGEGWDARAVPLDDALLCAGFHAVEGEGGALRRWTAGRARLPAALWSGEGRTLVVRLDGGMPTLPRWVGPGASPAAGTEAA